MVPIMNCKAMPMPFEEDVRLLIIFSQRIEIASVCAWEHSGKLLICE